MEIVDPALLEFFRSIAHYSQLMISSLRFSPEDEERLQHSSLLHDLGRMGIDRRIIEKKSKLTPQEWEIIHGHPLNTAKYSPLDPRLVPLFTTVVSEEPKSSSLQA